MANIDPAQVQWNDAPAAGGQPANSPAPKAAAGSGIDPASVHWLGAIAKGVQNQGRVTADQQSGRHHPPVQKFGQMPFIHQAVLASMNGKEEKKLFLEKEYGAGSVTEDKRGLIVKGKDGKMLRASSGFLANVVSDAPETLLGIAGAVSGGAVGGPVGAIAGAAAGAGAGKTIKEGAKAITGTYHKTPGQYARGVERAMEGGAIGEVTGRGTGKVLSRLSRGPLPKLITGATPETKAMTERTLAGGARPPPQSTMPDARKIQRIAILADKLSGPSHAIDRANKGYLYERADKILQKAGLGSGKRKSAVKSMEGTDAALSTQQTGQMIQSSVRSVLQQFKASNLKPTGQTVKAVAYLKQLDAAAARSPEDAYKWLVARGQTDRLEKFIGVTGGLKSPVAHAVQDQALRHLLVGAMVEVTENKGMTGVIKGLGQFTEKQQKILFPGGLHEDLKLFDKEIKFLYPAIHDPGMAGFTSGSVMNKKFYERWYHQAVGAVYRGVLQQPAVIRRLATGFRGTSAQRTAAKAALKEMFYFGAIEASEPSEQPQQQQPQR